MTTSELERRIAGEKSNIRKVCKALIAGGYRLNYVDDGEERTPVANVKQAIEAVTAVDMAHIVFLTPAGEYRNLYIVLGNSPEEVVSDYSAWDDDFQRIVSDVTGGF